MTAETQTQAGQTKSTPIAINHTQFCLWRGERRGGGVGGGQRPCPGGAGGQLGKTALGQLQAWQAGPSCPRAVRGAAARPAVMRSQRWAALHLGPPACSTVVSGYGQLGAFLVTPHLALPSERVLGHGEGVVETLEGAGEPPTRPPPGPQRPASSVTDPLRDLGQVPSLPNPRYPQSKRGGHVFPKGVPTLGWAQWVPPSQSSQESMAWETQLS